MMQPTKSRAIDRLERVLDEIPSLKQIPRGSQEFTKWRRSAGLAIRYAFPDSDEHIQSFEGIRYSLMAFTAGTPDSAFQNAYVSGLNAAEAILESMIEEIEEYWPEVSEAHADNAEPSETEPVPINTDQVFVVHGRNQKAREAMFTFLRTIGLHPLEWNEAVRATGKTMPYIGEILDAAFTQAGAVVVLMTPDDEARLREPFRSPNDPPHETELTGQARPNVLFEAGMAMGRNADRTILVELGSLRPFSDVSGLHVIRMDNSSQRRQELAQRLESAGCPVNLDGIDWHSAGDFDAAL